MSTNKRKVFIALKMAGIAEQGKLAGVFHYLNERHGERSPWDVQLVRTKSELTEDALKAALSDGTDGFIVSIPDTEDAIGRQASQFLLGQGKAHSYAFLHSDPMTDWSRARFEVFKRGY